jgi:hypothetical protein
VPRRFRDAAGALAVALVLFTVLMVTVKPVRQRVMQFAHGSSAEWLAPGHAVSGVMTDATSVALGYAAGNLYLVFFLIVAGFLFLLMLRT